MSEDPTTSVSRRRFLKTAGVTALAASAGPAVIIPGRAQPKKLKIIRIKSFTTGHMTVFREFAEAWGKKNNTEVIVDFVGLAAINEQIFAEAKAQQGHDIVMPATVVADLEEDMIDHREIYEECERHYGKALDLATRYTFNLKTQRFWGVLQAFNPNLVHYRKDLWDAIGMVPDTWNDIRLAGRQLKLLHDRPIGIDLSPARGGVDNNGSARSLLYAFGGSVQNGDGKPALKSRETLEAIKFAKALYEESMTEEILGWNGFSDNNLFMLSGNGSLTLNSPSITRSGESKQLPVTANIWLAPLPKGPYERLGPDAATVIYSIWKFAENTSGAKQFLIDYIGESRAAFIASGFGLYPSFPQTVPDLNKLVANDVRANPTDKYKVVADVTNWTTNVGYPGYLNPAIAEIFNASLIPRMFAHAASAKMTAEEAMTQADQEVRKIYDKWRSLGKI